MEIIGKAAIELQRRHPDFDVTVMRTFHGLRVAAERKDNTAPGLVAAVGTPAEVDQALSEAEAGRCTPG